MSVWRARRQYVCTILLVPCNNVLTLIEMVIKLNAYSLMLKGINIQTFVSTSPSLRFTKNLTFMTDKLFKHNVLLNNPINKGLSHKGKSIYIILSINNYTLSLNSIL